MATFGNACIDRPTGLGSYFTYFDYITPCTAQGRVTQVCVYLNEAGYYGKVKIFRPSGTDILFVGESASQLTVIGANTFSGLGIEVQSGDLVGYYQEGGNFPLVGTSSPGQYCYQLGGDITTTTSLSSWTALAYTISCLATYTLTYANIYVNSSTGNDTYAGDSCAVGHPVLTFAKAYELLASGGTIHWCNSGADPSTETVTLNKSFSIDLNGADGYFYMPQAS